jgi:metal-responsive CopG/Arc/MetJ family transcriptional regulator
MKIKTHLAIPEEILSEVDQVAGKRRRSLFIAEATREKLERARFLKILETTGGAWSDKMHPELRTAKSVESFVSEKRQHYRKRLKRTIS